MNKNIWHSKEDKREKINDIVVVRTTDGRTEYGQAFFEFENEKEWAWLKDYIEEKEAI